MSEQLPFKISSALKSLIGKELITDEFVAVFELVKNAFDANAKKVQIIFENQLDEDNGKVIIKDNGKGMDYDDLTGKWLFVAYSAKKDGSENDDYRDRIKVNRVFAGAKGVGRFSCDRLGKRLKLTSVKDGQQDQLQQIVVNWEDFEEDPKEEFVNVKVDYSSIPNSSGLEHGTILEIEGLRDHWDRDRLLKLKKSLAKLINPNQGNDSKNFAIEILAESEHAIDDKEKADRDRVNGPVNNQIFENLKIKTTSLVVEISADGGEIKSTLSDRGDIIYVLKEKNPLRQYLHDIKIHLFQLNFAAKSAFKREMGIESVKYGSVFLYKNGFRVYPFGEQGEDLLLIDRRKQQGYNRFLGTRDIIGRIEINGKNQQLTETTSRDGGLVKTETYLKLVEFFYDYVLFRLENYAVNIIKWGDEKIDKETGEIHPELWPRDVKIQILELITGFIKSDNVISIDYDKDFLNIIESKQDKSVEKIIKNISRIGANSNNPTIIKEAAKIGKVVKEIKSDSERKERENVKLKAEKAQTDEKLKYTIGQNLFLSDSVKADTKELQSLLHHTEKSTYWINKYIESLINGIDKGLSKEKLYETIDLISWENQKIFSFTKYHKSTRFNTFVDKINQDIIAFINQYVNNVIKFYEEYEKLNIDIITPHGLALVKNFTPVEIPIMIDNLLNNSKKAGARSIVFEWKKNGASAVILTVHDNGKGIDPSIAENIFDFRFTTTRGSGLGLYHVKKVVRELNGEIKVDTTFTGGAKFIVNFSK